MAQTSYPFDGVTVSESQFSSFFKELQDSGVAGSADSTALKVTADAGGMRVFVSSGSAIVRGFFYNNDASVQLTIGAATSLVRYDRVVLRLDPSTNSIVLAVVAGTPGAASPAALVQTTSGIYELPLAVVTVGASVANISSGAVADDRVFIGHNVGVWSTAKRPASPRQYQPGYNTSLGYFEHWDGTAWVQSHAKVVHSHGAAITDKKVFQAGKLATPIFSTDTDAPYVVTFPTPFDNVPVVTAQLVETGASASAGARTVGIVLVHNLGTTSVRFDILPKGSTFAANGPNLSIHWTAVDPLKLA